MSVLLAVLAANCAGFAVTPDPVRGGATWTYQSTDDGVAYSMQGVLLAPPGAGSFPAVVLSHGKGGSPESYARSAVGRTMVGWGLVVIAPRYTHASVDGGQPSGGDGASEANVLRGHKARDLLGCLGSVDLTRVAAHGHSMGAYVTGQMVGTYPHDFRAASHTAGGVVDCPNPSQCPAPTKRAAAERIVAPYQLHHSRRDPLPLAQDQTLAGILSAQGVPFELHVNEYEFPNSPTQDVHRLTASDPTMLALVREWYLAHGVLP